MDNSSYQIRAFIQDELGKIASDNGQTMTLADDSLNLVHAGLLDSYGFIRLVMYSSNGSTSSSISARWIQKSSRRWVAWFARPPEPPAAHDRQCSIQREDRLAHRTYPR